MKILVLEDEQRAGQKLIDLINGLSTHIDLHWKRSVEDGMAFLKSNTDMDLIFSDIELLDGNVFEIYNKIKVNCPIIFCTAYDRFYLNAFKTNGIAYLLKPYTKEQFQEAWLKYERLFKENKATNQATISPQLLQDLQLLVGKEAKKYRKVFTVKKNTGIFLLKIEDVTFFQAQGDFVVAYDQFNKKHILNRTLSSIESSLNPNQFFKINRSEILHIDFIVKYETYFRNKLAITVTNTTEKLYTSTSKTPGFRQWLEE